MQNGAAGASWSREKTWSMCYSEHAMKIIVLVGAAAILVLIAGTLLIPSRSIKNLVSPQRTASAPMYLTSPSFEHNQPIPRKYTCDGENVSPPLVISDVPPEAKSLVLIVDDPDAPAQTWVHWILWNLDPATKDIPEGVSAPATHQGLTSFGRPGYGGPCPPSGTHRYFFKLYALDISLPPSPRPNPTKEDVEAVLANHTLVSTELIGLYRRETR